MSGRLTTTDRRILVGAATVAFVLLAVTVLLTPHEEPEGVPTTYSARSGGALAAYQLLARSGYDVSRWDRPLTDLDSASPAVLILADPEELPTDDERLALKTFVERGGRVIATGASGAMSLPDRLRDLDRDQTAAGVWIRAAALVPSPAARAAPEISISPDVFVPTGTGSALSLYGKNGRAFVTSRVLGQGRVMWWAAATPLTNAGLREPGNLEFMLAAIDGTGRRILWDEYVHGHRRTPAPAVGPAAVWFGIQLVVVAAAVLLTYSRRSGPLIPAAIEQRLSPLEFVHTLGALYHRARAASVAVEIGYQRFTFALRKRVGLPSHASIDDMVRAACARWPVEEVPFRQLLQACDAATHDSELAPARALALTQALASEAATLKLFPNAASTHEQGSASSAKENR